MIEEVWRHLEQVEPQWEMESVIRCDRIVDRRFGTMYTAEVVRTACCGVLSRRHLLRMHLTHPVRRVSAL